MKMALAERLSVTATEKVTVDQGRAVIREFLVQLAQCPLCDGTGRYTFDREVQVDAKDSHGVEIRSSYVSAGTVGLCPKCVEGNGDPEFVAWHCTLGKDDHDCRASRERGNGPGEDHDDCGFRLCIRIPSDPA
jgi:hypothetical protein